MSMMTHIAANINTRTSAGTNAEPEQQLNARVRMEMNEGHKHTNPLYDVRRPCCPTLLAPTCCGNQTSENDVAMN